MAESDLPDPIETFTYYMDTKRHHDPHYIQYVVKALLIHKLSGRRFDLVISSDDDALNFVLEHRSELFDGMPIVFCGANNIDQARLTGYQGVTGVIESASVFETLNTAFHLHPDVRKAVVVGGTADTTSMRNREALIRIIPRMPASIAFEFWEDAYEDLIPKLSRLSAESLIVYNGVLRDRDGHPVDLVSGLQTIRAQTTIPIYSFWEFFVGHGIAGGQLVSADAQGRVAGAIALRILQGQPPEDIPVESIQANDWIFDWNELRRFKVPEPRLPSGSLVRNKPEPFYHIDRDLFWGGLSGSLLLIGMLGGQFWHTRHKLQAERALRESEARLRSFINHAPVIVWGIDSDGRLVFSDGKALEALNPNPDEMAGPSLFDLYRDHPELQDPFRKALKGETSFREIDLGGRIFEMHCEPLTESDGNVSGAVGIAFDVTEPRKNKRKQMIIEQRYRQLFENTSDFLCFHDLQGKIIQSNVEFKNHYQWMADILELGDIRRILPPYLRPNFDAYLERVRNNGMDQGRTKVSAPDGSEVVLEYRSVLIFDAEGLPIGIQAAANDITERLAAQKRLEASEEHFRMLFENAGDAILILKADGEETGTIVQANPAAARMHGYDSPTELVGLPVVELCDAATALDAPNKIRQMRDGATIHTEIHHIRKDGSPFPVEVTAKMMEAGGERFILAFDRDISARKAIEARNRALEGKLRQSSKLEAIGTLAGGIAHDFNNILSAIIGNAEILKAYEIGEQGRAGHSLDQIIKAVNRAEHLVRQILTFSRQSEQEIGVLRVTPVAREVVRLVRATLPSTATLEMVAQADRDTITGDPTLIHQVIMNLCTNAFQSLDQQQGEITVRLSTRRVGEYADDPVREAGLSPGHYLELAVSDTGSGIPKAIRNRIFDPYFTTKRVGEGTGLGLSVVHGIVQSLDGAIAVESESGIGSTFHVWFPLVEYKTAFTTAPTTTEPISSGTERVLIVDDEAALADVGKRQLEALGYSVTVRTDSRDALRDFLAHPDRFDVVLTDMTMPHMTGAELARELISIRPDIPVILCSGYSDLIDEAGAMEAGISEFISKPLDMSRLANAIRSALNGKTAT